MRVDASLRFPFPFLFVSLSSHASRDLRNLVTLYACPNATLPTHTPIQTSTRLPHPPRLPPTKPLSCYLPETHTPITPASNMAPRKPKADDDAASTTSTDVPSVLKPKTEKAKVEKPKVTKPRALKKEKVDSESGAGATKEKSKAVKKEKEKGEDGEGKAVGEGKALKTKGDAKSDGKDGKEKVKPVAGEEAVELIGNYLKVQNRPYSATEVSLNLHGKV